MTVGRILGFLIPIFRLMASDEDFQRDKTNIADLLSMLLIVLYATALGVGGVRVLTFERKQKRWEIAERLGRSDAKKFSVVCLVVCTLFGVCAGWLVAPSFFGTVFGLLIGGAGWTMCRLVWQNQSLSVPRRIYICIFITFLVLVATLIESALIAETPLWLRVVMLLLLGSTATSLTSGPKSVLKVEKALKQQDKSDNSEPPK